MMGRPGLTVGTEKGRGRDVSHLKNHMRAAGDQAQILGGVTGGLEGP